MCIALSVEDTNLVVAALKRQNKEVPFIFPDGPVTRSLGVAGSMHLWSENQREEMLELAKIEQGYQKQIRIKNLLGFPSQKFDENFWLIAA